MATKTKKKLRPERKWTHRRTLKSAFLSAVAGRLRNDVGPYFGMIQDVYARTRVGVGFWALARMIFPVIEAVSTVIYRAGSRRGGARERQPVRLFRELGFQYPNLAWEMYRHTLMHNDEMATAAYRGRRIGWEIRVGGGHVWTRGRLGIDVEKLYQDFLAFLDQEAASSSTTQVWVKESFRFNAAFGRATRDEALRLGSR
jgi:hypothetical protein